MKKSLAIIIVTLLILAIVSYLKFEVKNRLLKENPSANTTIKTSIAKDYYPVLDEGYKNATYILDGQSITLKNGIYESEVVPGSAAKSITSYFGNEVKKDFNGDGREDIAFLLSQETGGTGVFFYLVVALKTENGYLGSNGFFIGDRIAPQSTQLGDNNSIIVNYADRGVDEPFSADPTIGKSIKLLLDTGTMTLNEIPKN